MGNPIPADNELTGSIPSGSDLDKFSVAVRATRARAGTLYDSTSTSSRFSHDELMAALEELSVAEEELRAQHEALLGAHDEVALQRTRYQTLFNFAPDPYIVTDENGVIEDANAAAVELLGSSVHHLLRKPIATFIEMHARREFRAHLAGLPVGGRLDKWMLEIKTREGKSVPVEATVSTLASSILGKTSLCWLMHDMRSQRETEESMQALNRALNARVAQRTRELELALEGEQAARKEAEAANRIKSELFARLSHEFRTPLHAVSGYLEILQQNIHGGLTAEQRRDVERIHQAQDHLLTLVNMILDFAKLEGGPIELSMAEIPIEETLVSAEALVSPQFAKKNIIYAHRAGDPTVTAFADREKLQQIVVNLLANAMKFTPPGGTVELDWKIEDETLVVRVKDTGPGIPAEKVDEIFEPFVQLRTPGSLPPGGTGLGLPISRDLARAMGGDVRVASALGVGSVFTLTLPLRKRSTSPKLSA
ncbi:MAG TPA: ATP-binding protein [Gemmatimonadaceae bacterium]|nr:ATP-binding protein [Gemmatimonadaceae bacterium]